MFKQPGRQNLQHFLGQLGGLCSRAAEGQAQFTYGFNQVLTNYTVYR